MLRPCNPVEDGLMPDYNLEGDKTIMASIALIARHVEIRYASMTSLLQAMSDLIGSFQAGPTRQPVITNM